MTQKGESNHYNVKLLKGYGFSIKVKDNKLVFKNSYDPFNEPVRIMNLHKVEYNKIDDTIHN